MRSIVRSALVLALAGAASAALAAPVTTPDYLARAGQSDLFERASGKVMDDTTTDPAIRTFAERMIADHTGSTAMVLQAAGDAGFHPSPPELSPRQLRLLADLKEARGRARDDLYVRQQIEAHADALKLNEDYALSGGIAPIKAAAARIVPIVQDHLAMLRRLRPD